PAMRSSTTMPQPPGSPSAWRAGKGLRMSISRNRTKPMANVAGATGRYRSVTKSPAASSITTGRGSFSPISRAATPDVRMARIARTTVARAHPQGGSSRARRYAGGDALLDTHALGPAFLLQRFRHVVRQGGRGCSLLLRIREHADVIELGVPDERAERAKLLTGLPGKAHDEGAAQRDSRNTRAQR